MRKEAKASHHTKCAFKECHVGSFKKNTGYHRNNLYFCGKTHHRKWKESK